MKQCPTCMQFLAETLFSRNAAREDGLAYRCKACAKVKKVESGLGKPSDWVRKTADIQKYRREYNQANRDRFRGYENRRRSENPEKFRQRDRRRYLRRMQEQYGPDWLPKPKKDLSQLTDEQRKQRRRDQVRASKARWKLKNPDKAKAKNRVKHASRRARAREAEGRYTRDEVLSLYKYQKGRCAVCDVALSNQYHADHITALSKGGTNDIGNIQLLCPSCNIAKSNRCPIEFMQSLGKLL